MRRLKLGFAFGTIVFLGVFATLFVMFLLKLREAEEALQTPEFQDRMEAVSQMPSRILTADGVELYRQSAEYRIPIKELDEIPPHVRNAMLAAEDKRFYDHPGVDSIGLMRAFGTVFKDGRVSQGGSTITMQMAKRLFSGSEKTFSRKVQDIAYAYAIEKYKTKDQILLLYLNQVYFGETAHGIAAAAKVYLNKDVKDLTVSDAALLARCVRLPSRYNPIKDMKSSMENRDAVLHVMRLEGMINESEYEKALKEVPKINKKPPTTTARRANFAQHIVQHVLDTIKADMPEIDLKTGGYTIYTTIDSKLQKLAEKVTRDVVHDSRGHKVNQGAFVAMDADGHILCEVGGVSFKRNQYNIVTHGLRQPGSAFKAFVYAVGFQTGAITSPESYISNSRISIYDPWRKDSWTPENASRSENAPGYSARTAFAISVNRPAIHLLEDIGPRTVVEYAHDNFGIKSKLEAVLPLAIGSSAVRPIEMLEAYSVFMLRGDRVKPYIVSRIVAPSGEVVKQYQPQKFVGMMSPAVCDTMDDLMAAVVSSGTGTYAQRVPNARGKTGTTNDARDAWFCGYADGVVGVGWVGNEQMKNGVPTPVPMSSSVYGGTVTVKIWTGVMKSARERFGSTLTIPAPGTLASAAHVKPKPDPEDLEPIIDEEPISKPVDEGTPPDGLQAVPETTPPPVDENQPPTIDPAELERQRKESEQEAEKERQKAIEREARREARRKEQEERRRNQNNVTLEVCADSGMLANMYCPETVTRTVSRDRAPSRQCTVHGPG